MTRCLSAHAERSHRVPEGRGPGLSWWADVYDRAESGITWTAHGACAHVGAPAPLCSVTAMALAGPQALLEGGRAWVGGPRGSARPAWRSSLESCEQPSPPRLTCLTTFSLVCFLPPACPSVCLSAALIL